MSARGWILGAIGTAIGLGAAGTTIAIARQQRAISHRPAAHVPFGSLRSKPLTVVADDGLALHVEIDEVHPPDRSPKRRWGADAPEVTVVFVHGLCLNLDCWHYQRAAYRGLIRSVFYDQRSHGRSGRSGRAHATIEQLGRDLKQVIDHVASHSPVVQVASMTADRSRPSWAMVQRSRSGMPERPCPRWS